MTAEFAALVEKAARAIARSRHGEGEEYAWRAYEQDARAVLPVVAEDLQEVGEAMERAAAMDIYRHQDCMAWVDAATCWRAMLAAHPIAEAAKDG